MFKYSVTAECHFNEKLIKNQQLSDFIFSIESDILEEYFYYSIHNEKFLTSYEVDFTIDTKQSIYYITFHIYAQTDELLDEFKKIYDPIDFDLNEIFIICGDGCDEIYNEYNLPRLTITNIYLTYAINKYD